VTLQREFEEQGGQQFDVLAVDAFSGDSIPMHLLTEEAMDLYWRHLADDGVLGLHLTNIHLDLFDVVRNLAQHAGKQAFLIVDRGAKAWEMKSDWVIITSNRALIGRADFAQAVSRWPTKQPEPIYWTDNFSNLYDVVLWN
jgi:spermidine synthase